MNDAINRSVSSAIESHLDTVLNSLEYTTDTSEYVYVDGEEGDHGITRYLHEGKCFLVNFNFAGDWEENILTPYGIDLLIRPIFNESIELDIETIDGENMKTLLQYFGNTKAHQEEMRLGNYLDSPHVDQESKDEITKYLNGLRNLGLDR